MPISNCRISEILFITHIIMFISANTIASKKDFVDSLEDKQKTDYARISSRRLIVYLYGGLFGALFAHLFVKERCSQALAIILIQIIYYSVYPWPEFMKDYLETPIQNELWAKLNKDMSFRYTTAIFVGGLSTMI